jgi:hypothetical protein
MRPFDELPFPHMATGAKHQVGDPPGINSESATPQESLKQRITHGVRAVGTFFADAARGYAGDSPADKPKGAKHQSVEAAKRYARSPKREESYLKD